MIKQGYHKLIVYEKSKELVVLIYTLTAKFPREEKYSLVPQMRRSAISIVANVVEGYAKNSAKDFARFLNISIGSAMELELYLELSLELKYFSKLTFTKVSSLLSEVQKMLYSFQKSMRLKHSRRTGE